MITFFKNQKSKFIFLIFFFFFNTLYIEECYCEGVNNEKNPLPLEEQQQQEKSSTTKYLIGTVLGCACLLLIFYFTTGGSTNAGDEEAAAIYFEIATKVNSFLGKFKMTISNQWDYRKLITLLEELMEAPQEQKQSIFNQIKIVVESLIKKASHGYSVSSRFEKQGEADEILNEGLLEYLKKIFGLD